MRADEFYSMTWGNFQRYSIGFVKRQWVVNRELIAAIVNGYSKKRVTGEDIFPFGVTQKFEPPSEQDRDLMERVHKARLKQQDGRS